MDSEELFAPHFRGDSWDAWRSFLAGLFALPMTDAQLARFRQHTGRSTAPAVPFKEAALICGRRAGKSRILAAVAVYLAAFRDYGPHLAPGERATVAVIAADRRQARTIFRYIIGLFGAVPVLADLVEREAAEVLDLTNGVTIEIHTASYRVTRGYTLAAALADETAFWRSDEGANPDTEILAALRPGLASIPGAMLLLASSPYSKRGALYDAFRRHFGHDDARVLVWQAPTAAMNPRIDPEIIREAYESDPQSAAAEYGAQFRDDIAAFVSREVVDACIVPGRHELPRVSGVRYVAFVDPSGGSADAMTLGIAHAEGDRVLLDCVREVRPPFSPDVVAQDFAGLLKAYGLDTVTGDRYGGEWPRERFRAHGIEYQPAEKPKSDLYRELLPLLNAHRAELLDLPRLTGQLVSLERRTARGGRDSIDHPPAAHDDLANSAAGALVLAAQGEAGGGYDLLAMMGMSGG
ncbi:hypothetical protein EXY23_05140 [Roseicella aquatilis]|uniref:Terminase n=2 Tax=Roseicella aquatilis TaxID=2527868 RepID=A0A4R4DUN6_9PROT|nr:hypothetical protein EXY23_05140 [Roseicella aquatilis]